MYSGQILINRNLLSSLTFHFLTKLCPLMMTVKLVGSFLTAFWTSSSISVYRVLASFKFRWNRQVSVQTFIKYLCNSSKLLTDTSAVTNCFVTMSHYALSGLFQLQCQWGATMIFQCNLSPKDSFWITGGRKKGLSGKYLGLVPGNWQWRQPACVVDLLQLCSWEPRGPVIGGLWRDWGWHVADWSNGHWRQVAGWSSRGHRQLGTCWH